MEEEKKAVEDKAADKKTPDKDKVKKTSGEPGKGTKKKFSLKMILIISGVILALGGASLAAITYFKKGSPAESETNITNEDLSAIKTENYKLETFIVNLTDSERNKYLKVTMELEIAGLKAKEDIEANLSKIRDVIVLFLSAKSFDEVKSIEGKIDLKTELVKRINASLKSSVVREIYFTEFVVQ